MPETTEHIVIVGAGAAGLMAARELARTGRKVTVLEARERCGGRILPLPVEEFGYPAAGGAEFVHGEAPVTRELLREAGLSLREIAGEQWSFDGMTLSREERDDPHEAELQAVLRDLKDDLSVAEFLRRHFAGDDYAPMRQSIERMVEGYDAADPERASTLALREEWMDGGHAPQARIDGGYGALIDFLAADCRRFGVTIHLGCVVSAIEEGGDTAAVRCAGGDVHVCDRVILTVPLPLLREMALPASARARLAAAGDIGFGNVIKILLRFARPWWRERHQDLAAMTFLLSDRTIPGVVDAIPGRAGRAHRLVRRPAHGGAGQPRSAGTDRCRARFARRHFQAVARGHRARARRGGGDQLGTRSLCPRCLFLGDAADACGTSDPRACRWPGAVFRRSSLSRP
ncbi:monoamine oxidase [Bradyrhizobium ottawaense]